MWKESKTAVWRAHRKEATGMPHNRRGTGDWHSQGKLEIDIWNKWVDVCVREERTASCRNRKVNDDADHKFGFYLENFRSYLSVSISMCVVLCRWGQPQQQTTQLYWEPLCLIPLVVYGTYMSASGARMRIVINTARLIRCRGFAEATGRKTSYLQRTFRSAESFVVWNDFFSRGWCHHRIGPRIGWWVSAFVGTYIRSTCFWGTFERFVWFMASRMNVDGRRVDILGDVILEFGAFLVFNIFEMDSSDDANFREKYAWSRSSWAINLNGLAVIRRPF